MNSAGAKSLLPLELHVLVPFWGMAGGVIKVLDYARHAVNAGVHVSIWAPPFDGAANPVASLPVVSALRAAPTVRFEPLEQLAFRDASVPWVLFTEPGHMRLIEQAAEVPLGARLIQLVQGTRHANPDWNDGLNYRLLHRPMTRIAVTSQVAAAIQPHVNRRFETHTIVEGHDCDYFAAGAPERTPGTPLRVLYATWKSDLGDRVATELASDDSIVFDAIRTDIGWPALRSRYHEADVFLCTPGPEEGFYLPGLEAMAAGCAVVSAFVGGNEAYLDEGQNVLRAGYDDVESHARALRHLSKDNDAHQLLVRRGRITTTQHLLQREGAEFAAVLEGLTQTTGTQQVP